MNEIPSAEYALYQLNVLIDDLTSMAHDPRHADTIASFHWTGLMRRMVDLQDDARQIAAAQKIAAE